MIHVQRGDPRHPEATALLKASQALMRRLFPSTVNHAMSIDALCEPGLQFFTATRDSRIVGTGALLVRDGYGEVKSMFVDPNVRGSGAGSALLAAIEASARKMGVMVLRLETGSLLHAAHRLYQRHGFLDRPAFGGYCKDAKSRFMEKRL